MIKMILVFAVLTSILFGCKNVEKTDTSVEGTSETVDSIDLKAPEIDAHTSENSLDWAGVYEGTTPCADCEGIKTVLELKSDKTYILSQTYLGKPKGENELNQTGNFKWNQPGTMIRIRTETGGFQFKVGENQLWMLDAKGNMIEGDLADMYILKKTIQ